MAVLTVREALGGELHKVAPQLVLEAVHPLLPPLHLGEGLGPVLHQQVHRLDEVFLGGLRHPLHSSGGLLQGHGGIVQEALVQEVGLQGLLLLVLRRVREGPDSHLLQKAPQGEDQQHRRHLEGGVHLGDAHAGGRSGEEGEGPPDTVGDQEEDEEHPAAHQVKEEVGEGRPLGVLLGADGAEQHRHAGADAAADDHEEGDAAADGPGGAERLQDAHRGGAALQHRRHGDADADGYDGVLHHRQDP